VARLVSQCPIPCSTWDAVDGSKLSPSERSVAYQPNLKSPAYPFALKPGEIGCFLSHRGLWKEMIKHDIPQALILEDDVELSVNFANALQFASAAAEPGDYIQFQVRDLHPRGQIVVRRDPFELLCPTIIPLRTSAQLVTLAAAERLLRHSEPFDRPVDSFLQMNWLHGARALMVKPQSVTEISATLGGSTIGANRRRRGPLDVVSRQWNRAVYRLRIAALAKSTAGNLPASPLAKELQS
jgi:glycosyl transferase, family 25